ncbi:hypothetical protein, partial [Bacillus pumilus]|uniref:hypothetical protein n=1 Tax=Bacillus pumilus TaxID=1408 RepID=UPI001C92BD89
RQMWCRGLEVREETMKVHGWLGWERECEMGFMLKKVEERGRFGIMRGKRGGGLLVMGFRKEKKNVMD